MIDSRLILLQSITIAYFSVNVYHKEYKRPANQEQAYE